MRWALIGAGTIAAESTIGALRAAGQEVSAVVSSSPIRDMIRAGGIGRVLSLRLFHAVHLPPHLQRWRIDSRGAGGGLIPNITMHDADVARFLLDQTPATVAAQMTANGTGQGVEDSAMSVWRMPSDAMVIAHESFTHPFAGSGLEVHGTEGSIVARGVMTQQSAGEIELGTATGRETVTFPSHDPYAQGVTDFLAAVAGKSAPAATAQDDIASLAVALAGREAARTCQRQLLKVPA